MGQVLYHGERYSDDIGDYYASYVKRKKNNIETVPMHLSLSLTIISLAALLPIKSFAKWALMSRIVVCVAILDVSSHA